MQRHDKIELSSVVDTTPYAPEQIAAGIPQNVGGALFFIMVNWQPNRLLLNFQISYSRSQAVLVLESKGKTIQHKGSGT